MDMTQQGSGATPAFGDRPLLKKLLSVLGVGCSLFQLWAIVFAEIDPLLHRAIFLVWIMAFAFLSIRAHRSEYRQGPSAIEIAEALLVIVAGGYYVLQFDRILSHWPMIDPMTGPDLFFGAVILLVLLDLTRRVVGWPVVIITLLFCIYALAGDRLGGSFSHRPFSLAEFIDQMVYTLNGIMGTPLGVAATYVYMFILFGVVLFHSGGGEFFLELAKSIAGGARGGAAKVAVVACGLFGMISGSPTSDAVTTGTFTIPLMKRMGYRAAEAGAIVAVAATGGSIMPPVMGSAAFLMAEFTGIRYVQIAIAGAVPALLYYLGVLAQVHFLALKNNMTPLEQESRPQVLPLLAKNFQFLLPLVALTWMLLRGNTPTQAAAVALALTVAASWVRPETRMGLRKILSALEEAARAGVVVVAATASAGILVGVIGITGAGGKFSGLLFQMSGETLFPALVVTMIVCIILGMGMPVPSAYILTAVVAGPALVRLGIPVLSAHLFIVYFSVMSAITPPVAVAAFAAAGIAGGSPNEIGFKAVKLGIVAFVVPFMFIYQPEILLRGNPLSVALAVATATIGVIALAAGLEGWLLTRLAVWDRGLAIAGGLLMIKPGIYTDLGGLACVAAVLAWQLRQRAGMAPMKTPT